MYLVDSIMDECHMIDASQKLARYNTKHNIKTKV